MPTLDPYNITDKLDDSLLDVIVTRLETRGKHAFFLEMMQGYLDAMEIDASDSVLDIGCGTGVASRQIASRSKFNGSVLGVDLSPYLLAAAERLAKEEGLDGQVRFRAGDSQSLELADESFDAVVLHTLLSHVSDPAAVLGEARRVAKPGAMIAVFDGDYASVTFEQEDPAKSKADDEKLISAVVTQPRVMRQLPRLAAQLNLELVRVFPHVLAEAGKADFWASGIESFRKLVPKAQAMSEAEAEAWAGALFKASEDGVFFGASNYYAYVLKRN